MISRRSVLVALVAASVSGSIVAYAQARRLRKVALLMPTSADPHFWNALKARLTELGYVEGRDVLYESRSAEGRFERLPALAAELVRARPDVIVTAATPPVRAAKGATATIPIVIATAGDPVESGLVASFSRPGGNVTGVSNMAGETSGKVIELARTTMPALSRIAVLRNSANPAAAYAVRNADEAAVKLRFAVLHLDAQAPQGIDAAFAALARERVGAMIVLSDPFLGSQRDAIARLATVQRVPVFAQGPEYVRAGALMGYGPDYIEHFRRAAHFVDRILKGAKPGELPIEQAATFALAINRGTAATLGIKIPAELLLRATEVIE